MILAFNYKPIFHMSQFLSDVAIQSDCQNRRAYFGIWVAAQDKNIISVHLRVLIQSMCRVVHEFRKDLYSPEVRIRDLPSRVAYGLESSQRVSYYSAFFTQFLQLLGPLFKAGLALILG